MSTNYITLNGTQCRPTAIEIEDDKVGLSRRMGDGTLRYYHRGFKNRWSINWSGLRENSADYGTIQSLKSLTTSFTLTDVDGFSYTVLILPGGVKRRLSADKMNQAGLKYYDIDLVLDQV